MIMYLTVSSVKVEKTWMKNEASKDVAYTER